MRDVKAAQAARPVPPDDLDGEAMLEWDRICSDLEAIGRLDKTDRSIITLYCHRWAIYCAAMQHVVKFGPIVKHSNGVAGESPHYGVSKQEAAILRRLLTDMGLTPVLRGLRGDAGAGDLEL